MLNKHLLPLIISILLITQITFASENVSPGWARGAYGYSWVSSITTLSLCIGSEITKNETVPGLPLGASALLLTVISTPVIYAGGKSANVELPDSKRRTIGWVCYGGHIAMGTVLTVLGIVEVTPPPAVITVTGLIGSLAMINMGFDARDRANAAQSSAIIEPVEPVLQLGLIPVQKGAGVGIVYNF